MKKLLVLILFIANNIISNAQIPGTKIPGPITIFDSIKVFEGDTLHLGRGSDPRTGEFVFIYKPANYLMGTPQVYLQNMYANTTLKIKFFKEYENRKIGKKIFTIVDAGGLNTVAELEAAVKSGEIVAINSMDVTVKPKETTVIVNNQVSVADELKKLKGLLNDSIITQEEFELQKKKLLEK